jgi:hypothetical protein
MRRTGRSGSVEEGISLFSTPPLSQDHEQIQAEIADERALRNYERAAMGNASARATTHASARRLSHAAASDRAGTLPKRKVGAGTGHLPQQAPPAEIDASCWTVAWTASPQWTSDLAGLAAT